jgi:UDP-N-acetylmuramate--alanine ligase
MSIALDQSSTSFHFIGIGGAGMSALAQYCHGQGSAVTGSDVSESAEVDYLRELGISLFIGHDARHLGSASVVVYSSAIIPTNVEYKAAEAAGLRLLSRGACLAELMNQKKGIAVCGTHGKTTTTGMLAHCFAQTELDLSYVIGGQWAGHRHSMGRGQGDYFIAEADESDGSFLLMRPEIIVVTNIEPDHLGYYGNDFEVLKAAFLQFINALPETGWVLMNIDCPVSASLIPAITARCVTFGQRAEADWQITGINLAGMRSEFALVHASQLGNYSLAVPGAHNIYNAVPTPIIWAACQPQSRFSMLNLAAFPGMARRFEHHGRAALPAGGEVDIFEDYGHHPAAIHAVSVMLRAAFSNRRVLMVFHPHRYSRTRALLFDFIDVLSNIPMLFLLPVYAASEVQVQGGSSQDLYQALSHQAAGRVMLCDDKITAERLLSFCEPEDILLFQGAGDFLGMVDQIKRRGKLCT